MSYKVKDDVLSRKDRDSRRPYFDRHSDLTTLRQKPTQPIRFAVTADRVLRSFNTRAFKREQPDNPDLMLRFIAEALANDEPLSFVLYWGKGLRPFSEPEIKCLDFLASMIARVSQTYSSGARVTLIFTDTHAGLNGHSEQSINAYFESLTLAARQRGFETCVLSKLMLTVEAPEQDFSQAMPPPELFAMLRGSAAKWFRGEGTVEEGAIKYYQANILEKHVVERAFPRSIFVTFSPKELRSLLPDHLPIFFMYSLRHGVCDKPWFLPADFLTRHSPSMQRREVGHGS